jgi:hypothetical protein
MYVNGNMIPVETVPGIRGKGEKEGVNSSMKCLIYYKNSYKCHSVPPSNKRIFFKKFKEKKKNSDPWDKEMELKVT